MIIDENNDKLKQMRKDSWKFDFPFQTERVINSPPLVAMRKDKRQNLTYRTETDRHDGDYNFNSDSFKSTVYDDTINKPDSNTANVGNFASNYATPLSKSLRSVTPPSNPTTPTSTSTAKHNYSDPTIYYVSHDFFAATTEHLSVFVDDELELIEELPGGAWTRVKERDSQQIGLIPTEILESGAERLAKENKTSNQDSIRVLSCNSSSSYEQRKSRKKRKTVSFCEKLPEIVHYTADDTNDHSIFPFTLNDDISNAIAYTDATNCDILSDDFSSLSFEEPEILPVTHDRSADHEGFFKKLFKRRKPKDSETILKSLQDFEKYPDHLIRVYTGNFDSLLHGYKTFIVDESLTFDEFTQMVLTTFALDSDGFFYELNLVNHLTAEVVPLALDFTIEQVIELTKREGLAFSNRMPTQVRKFQKSALKRLKHSQQSGERDKSSDYVTPFKFVLNRVYSPAENVPIYVHVSLAYAMTAASETNLIITSLFPEVQDEEEQQGRVKKWYQRLKKTKTSDKPMYQSLHRLLIYTQDPVHQLIHALLTSLNVPQTLPGIAFEAFLPAIHDAIELPLPVNMPIGEVMKIRPKLDQSQQVIIIRPVLV